MSNVNSNNPWVARDAKRKYEPLPDDTYMADFAGVEDYAINGEPKWKWKWRIKTGDHAGKTADPITNPDISPDTKAGRFVKGLLGRDVVAGENLKSAIDACVGKTYMITVAPGQNGGKSAVQFVSRPPQM